MIVTSMQLTISSRRDIAVLQKESSFLEGEEDVNAISSTLLRYLPIEVQPGTQYLSNAPRLREAAARSVRCVTIEHLADRTQARGRQVLRHGREKFLRPARITVNTVVGAGERTQQPAPDCALMIARVALPC